MESVTSSVMLVFSSNKLAKCFTPDTPISFPLKSSVVIVKFSLIKKKIEKTKLKWINVYERRLTLRAVARASRPVELKP